MKIIFFVLCILLGLQGTLAQTYRPLPIPSFNVPVSGNTLFQESNNPSGGNTEGKRRIHVQVSSQKNADTISPFATIWVYSLDHTTIYGPFTVASGTTLTVDIDDRDWGVLVEANESVVVSVWITEEDAIPSMKLTGKAEQLSF